MAIPKLEANQRSIFGWFGESPSGESRVKLEKLGFLIEEWADDKELTAAECSGIAVVVFVQRETKPLRIVEALEANIVKLLDHDCRTFVLASRNGLVPVSTFLRKNRLPAVWPTETEGTISFDGEKEASTAQVGKPELPFVWVHRKPSTIESFARHALQYPASPSQNPNLVIDGACADELRDGERLMLRRAFHDCSHVHLESENLGKSGDNVLYVHATLATPMLESKPLPYFVKIGKRQKIQREWDNYEERVRPYVPFHLAPRLLSRRCFLAAKLGIIVGDFVDDSEGLVECARSGRAGNAIGALFDRTLRGWHFQASEEITTIYAYKGGIVKGTVPSRRLKVAHQFGATYTPNELRARMKAQATQPHLIGPTHSDLHAENIRIRGTDAILVDFLGARKGPLLDDAAALEVSLVVRRASEPIVGKFQALEWAEALIPLYCQDALIRPPPPGDSREPYHWLRSCIRRIRLHANALELQRGQYAYV